MLYINIVYIKNKINFVPNPADPEGGGTFDQANVEKYSLLLMIGIAYSTLYDGTQMIKQGLNTYLSDGWNAIDCIYIITGLS